MLSTIYEYWLYADSDDPVELFPNIIRLLLFFRPFPDSGEISERIN